ncbi:MAG: BamA/TamA family outer membrane protein [Deltaproteobacteria bacterium]|nr:BamA/TamA family outer membrane protein [Deltaproteobacteria bacterium]
MVRGRVRGPVPRRAKRVGAGAREASAPRSALFDAGNAFGDPWGEGNITPFGLRTAIGAGIRWQSPIGPLRFEYGVPLEPRENERKAVPETGRIGPVPAGGPPTPSRIRASAGFHRRPEIPDAFALRIVPSSRRSRRAALVMAEGPEATVPRGRRTRRCPNGSRPDRTRRGRRRRSSRCPRRGGDPRSPGGPRSTRTRGPPRCCRSFPCSRGRRCCPRCSCTSSRRSPDTRPGSRGPPRSTRGCPRPPRCRSPRACRTRRRARRRSPPTRCCRRSRCCRSGSRPGCR